MSSQRHISLARGASVVNAALDKGKEPLVRFCFLYHVVSLVCMLGCGGRIAPQPRAREEGFLFFQRPAIDISTGPLSAKPANLQICPPQAQNFNFKYDNIIKIAQFS